MTKYVDDFNSVRNQMRRRMPRLFAGKYLLEDTISQTLEKSILDKMGKHGDTIPADKYDDFMAGVQLAWDRLIKIHNEEEKKEEDESEELHRIYFLTEELDDGDVAELTKLLLPFYKPKPDEDDLAARERVKAFVEFGNNMIKNQEDRNAAIFRFVYNSIQEIQRNEEAAPMWESIKQQMADKRFDDDPERLALLMEDWKSRRPEKH